MKIRELIQREGVERRRGQEAACPSSRFAHRDPAESYRKGIDALICDIAADHPPALTSV